MNSNQELISIIMASNKVDTYLDAAIDSMLNQSHTYLELIFVANGEKCKTVAEHVKKNHDDSRLTVIETSISQLAHALNLGIDRANGKYIARMDCDDISSHDRIEKQLSFLLENNLDLVGCDLWLINDKGTLFGKREYPKGKKINYKIHFTNPFAHNTILVKKEKLILANGYNAGFNSEDYDLWLRLKRKNIKWENMDAKLVYYRIHGDSSQRKLLGYAESTALSVREFILNKSAINFLAIVYHFTKSFIRAKK